MPNVQDVIDLVSILPPRNFSFCLYTRDPVTPLSNTKLLHTSDTVQPDYSPELLFLILEHPLKTLQQSVDYFLNLVSKVHYPIFSLNFIVVYIIVSIEHVDFTWQILDVFLI